MDLSAEQFHPRRWHGKPLQRDPQRSHDHHPPAYHPWYTFPHHASPVFAFSSSRASPLWTLSFPFSSSCPSWPACHHLHLCCAFSICPFQICVSFLVVLQRQQNLRPLPLMHLQQLRTAHLRQTPRRREPL